MFPTTPVLFILTPWIQPVCQMGHTSGIHQKPVHCLHLKQSLQGFFPLCLKGCSKYDGGIKNKSTSVLGFSQSGGLYLNIDTLGVCSLQSHVLCQVLFRSTTLQFSLLCRKWWFVDEKYQKSIQYFFVLLKRRWKNTLKNSVPLIIFKSLTRLVSFWIFMFWLL